MDAPLSLYLTHFRRDEAPILSMPDSLEIETLTELDGDDQIEASSVFEIEDQQDDADFGTQDAPQDAVAEALRDVEAAHAEQIAEIQRSHEAALLEAVEAARAAWVVNEGARSAAMIDAAFAALKDELAHGVVAVLQPVLTEAILARMLQSVNEALDHLLADPDHPTIVLRGSGDLVAAIRAARVGSSSGSIERIDYVEAEAVELAIDAAGTHVETRLAAALAAIQEAGA